MDHRIPDLPTVPMPVAKPPRRRRKSWRVIASIIGALVLLCVGVGILGHVLGLGVPLAHSRRATQTSGTPAAIQTVPGTGTIGSTGTPALTRSPSPSQTTARPTPTQQNGPPGITYGRPHIGGPFSDFIGKYGQPTFRGDANSQDFWTGPGTTIDINVTRNEQGKATRLNILGSDTWNMQQTQSYCVQFLPDGATQYNATTSLIDYHSSAGNIALSLQSQSCLLSLLA